MKQIIFSVYDRRAEVYLPPFYHATVGSALRDFEGAVNHKDSQLNIFPEDFDLMELGTFDNTTAQFELHKVPKLIESAVNLHKQKSYYEQSSLVSTSEELSHA